MNRELSFVTAEDRPRNKGREAWLVVSEAAIAGFFGKVEPFKHLPETERVRLGRLSQEKHFARGETIFHEGEQADAMWVVRQGRIHLEKFLLGGQVCTSCLLTNGELFCCLPGLDRQAYSVDAVAATDTTLIRIPMQEFASLLERYPDFNRGALCQFCARLREVEARGCTLFDSVEKRIAQILLTLKKKFGETIPLTRQEIAELASTTVETAIRTVRHFQEEGWVRSSRGQIRLLRPDRLHHLLR